MQPAKAVDSWTLALLQVSTSQEGVPSMAPCSTQKTQKRHGIYLAMTYGELLSQSLTLSVTCHAVSASRCTSRCPISPLVLEPSRICLVSLEAPVSTRSFDPSEFACSSCDELPTEFRSIPIFKPCAGTHCFDCLWPPRTTPWDEVLGPKSLRIE
jgi:hypothetical protein